MGRTHLLLALAILTQVTVAQEPSLQLMPTNILKPMGDTIYVACKPNVTDLDQIEELKWIGPRGEIKADDEDTTLDTMDKRPHELGLFVQLTENNVGMYNCTAVYASNQNLNAGIMVNGYMDIDFGDTPEHQTPVINTEGVIRCSVTAKPAPQVDWLKNGKPITSDDHYIIRTDGVLISNIQPEDEGIYRCLARVEEIGSYNFKDISVEVYIPPEITTKPSDTKGIEKESVTFKCEASGNPAPEFSWVDKDNRPLNDVEGYYVDKESGMLSIHDLNVEHAGSYRCTATNAVGSDSATAVLRVVTVPRFEEMKNITVGVGEQASLNCIFSGDPLPDIKFRKESNSEAFVDGLNLGEHIQVSHQPDEENEHRQIGELKIFDVMRSDDGLYMCTGVSEGGETTAVGHITVEFPPSFEDQPTNEVWTWEQEPVNLTCIVTSIPNATVQWYFRNEEIPADNPQLQVLNLGPVGTLLVTPIDNSYYGTYTCEATNTRGTDTYDITLKEAHVPGPITQAKVDKKTATTITWNIIDPVDNGGRLITGYLVEYREDRLTWDSAESRYWVKGSTYLLENLTPKITYVFRFAARNDVGDGQWSGEKVEEMPHRTVPEEPLLFNMGEGVTEIPYTNSYNLQWSVPLNNGEPINYFQIIYYPVAIESDKWEMTPGSSKTTRQIDYPGETQYSIEGLQSDTHYKLELRAHNEIGFSTPAEAIIKTAIDHSAGTTSDAGQSVQFSSVAPTTTAPPAHGPPLPEPTETGGVSVGIIIAIVVVTIFVLAILIDLGCYFTQKAGVTAAIMGKRSSKDKDKEAMLKEVKDGSSGKLSNGETKEETTQDTTKVPTDKEPEKPAPDAKIVDETQNEDKGNGEVKGQEEKEDKEVKEVKEEKEPTETTPMIQGDKRPAAVAPKPKPPVKKIGLPVASQASPLHQDRAVLHQVSNTQYPGNMSKEKQKDEPRRAETTIRGKRDMGRPLSMMAYSENPYQHTSLQKKFSKSIPVMSEGSETEDSIYSMPYPVQHIATEVSGIERKPPLPPPRNPNTQLTEKAPVPFPRAPKSCNNNGQIAINEQLLYPQQTGQPYVNGQESINITGLGVHYQPQQKWHVGHHNQNGGVRNYPFNPNISEYDTFYDGYGTSESSLSAIYQTDPVHTQTSPKIAYQVAPYLQMPPVQSSASPSVKMEYHQSSYPQIQKNGSEPSLHDYSQQQPQQSFSQQQPQQSFPQQQPQQSFPQQQPQQSFSQQQPQQSFPQQQPQHSFPQQQPQQSYPQQQPQQSLPWQQLQQSHPRQQPQQSHPRQQPQQQPQQSHPQQQPLQSHPQQQPLQSHPQRQPQQSHPQQQPQQSHPQQQHQQSYPQQQPQQNHPQQHLLQMEIINQQNSSQPAHLRSGGKPTVLGAGRPTNIGVASHQRPGMPPPPPKPLIGSPKPKGLKTTTTLYFRECAKGQHEQQIPLSRSLDQLDSDYLGSNSSKSGTSSQLPSSSISSARSMGSLLNPSSSSSNSARSFGPPTVL
ncbi:fasciclin-2-like isoform X3 [Oratosquilla oratoria]